MTGAARPKDHPAVAEEAKPSLLDFETRQALGEALTEVLGNADAPPDWFDAREIDRVIEAIEPALDAGNAWKWALVAEYVLTGQSYDPGMDPVQVLAKIIEHHGGVARRLRTPEPFDNSLQSIANPETPMSDQREADAPTPPPIDALRWLYSHCIALGMKRKSESGQIEHDIALFIADLHRDVQEAQRQGHLAGYAGFGITPQPHHPGRWLSAHHPGMSFPSAHAAYMDAFGVKGAPT